MLSEATTSQRMKGHTKTKSEDWQGKPSHANATIKHVRDEEQRTPHSKQCESTPKQQPCNSRAELNITESKSRANPSQCKRGRPSPSSFAVIAPGCSAKAVCKAKVLESATETSTPWLRHVLLAAHLRAKGGLEGLSLHGRSA